MRKMLLVFIVVGLVVFVGCKTNDFGDYVPWWASQATNPPVRCMCGE